MPGCWKLTKRVSDGYDDMELPYPDAKVAAVLCLGGPVKYKLREGSNINSRFILQHVVPKIATKLGNNVAIVFGRALLWGAFAKVGEEASSIMPNWLSERIRTKYSILVDNDLAANISPVEKVAFIVTGNEGQVFMDEIPGNEEVAPNAGVAGTHASVGFSDRPIRDQLLVLHSQYFQLRTSQDALPETITNNHLQVTRGISMIILNTNRLAMAPFGRSRAASGGEGGGTAVHDVATLSPTPRSLHMLWQEYTVGIGGRNPARQFMSTERGSVKHKYSHRNYFWDVVDKLILCGFTAQVAIDGIYTRYGRELCVTKIIDRIKQDRRHHTVPAALD
jgi:hypothetical protein